MDASWMVDLVKELGGYVGVALAAILLTVFKKLRFVLVEVVKNLWSNHPPFPGRKDVEQNHRVYTELVELRALADSDRAYVMRFHNGNEFLPDNPVWKVTCTHEVVRPGVSYESANIQGVIVSRVHDMVDSIIIGESKHVGVSTARCSDCQSRSRCDKENKHVVVVQVAEMDGSYGKFMLEAQNVKTVVQAGVVGGGRVFGIVGVDFCDSKLAEGEEMEEVVRKVCRSAERMQYHLRYQEVPG